MKNIFLSFALLASGLTFASGVENSNLSGVDEATESNKSCTVTYTNSYGVTFSSTAETCTEAYENLMMHIEAKSVDASQ